jgi:hypothetical protein
MTDLRASAATTLLSLESLNLVDLFLPLPHLRILIQSDVLHRPIEFTAAFFRMSRSSVTRFTSHLSRFSSAAWSPCAARCSGGTP